MGVPLTPLGLLIALEVQKPCVLTTSLLFFSAPGGTGGGLFPQRWVSKDLSFLRFAFKKKRHFLEGVMMMVVAWLQFPFVLTQTKWGLKVVFQRHPSNMISAAAQSLHKCFTIMLFKYPR